MHFTRTIVEKSASSTWIKRLQSGGSKAICLLRTQIRTVADLLTKRLFLAAYRAADEDYWQHQGIRCEWRSLGGILEYSRDLLAVPREGAPPVFAIAIRCVPNADLKHVVIKVKAKKSGTIYEQKVKHLHLDTAPVRKSLSAIPLRPKSLKAADCYKLGSLYLKLEEATDLNGEDRVKGKKISDIFEATATNSAANREVERWGQYWNLDSIHREKENIRSRYYLDLVYSARQLGRSVTIRRAAYRLLASAPGLSLTFWRQNLLSADGIRRSNEQSFAASIPTPAEDARTDMP